MAAALSLKSEDLVWIPDEEKVWKKATVVAQTETTLTVKEKESGNSVEVPLSKTETYDPDHDRDWDNAFSMGDLNEAGKDLLKLQYLSGCLGCVGIWLYPGEGR